MLLGETKMQHRRDYRSRTRPVRATRPAKRLPRSPSLLLLQPAIRKGGEKATEFSSPGHKDSLAATERESQTSSRPPFRSSTHAITDRRLPLPLLLPFPFLVTASSRPPHATCTRRRCLFQVTARARGRAEIGRRAMAAPGGLDQDRDRGRGQDAAIKLFGRSIPVLHSSVFAATASEVSTKLPNDVRSNDGMPCLPNMSLLVKASRFPSKNNMKNGLQAISSQHGKMEADSKSEEVKNSLQAIISQPGKTDDSKSEEAKTESGGSGEEKVLKKPDKILPCPRCHSMETKFCYFNNYNVNQPRHFCRNCKRYWTAGGTMRNVPVGSGRRRNKDPCHHHHVTKPCDQIITANGDVSDATQRQSLAVKPSVLQGSGKQNETACNSVSPALNIKEQNNADLISLISGDNKEEKSCASSAVVSGSSENWMPETTVKKEEDNTSAYGNGVKEPDPNMQSHHAGPISVFSKNPAAVMVTNQCSADGIHGLGNGTVSPLSLPPPPMVPSPGICAPAVPFPLVPAFVSCIPGWPSGVWGAPWPGSSGPTLLSFPPNSLAFSGSNSRVLGKHTRVANLQEEQKAEKKFWVPKALRIDNPEEAAKSSIWASLGIKPDERIIFKSFQSKDLKNSETKTPESLQANPAAFSRSQTFQERI